MAFAPLWKNWSQQAKTSILIDVRMPAEFLEAHVPHAENFPLDRLKAEDFKGIEKLYILCKSGVRSCKAADKLNGIDSEIIVIEGGTDAWIEAGFRVERETNRLPIMRQVFLAAAVLLFIGGLGSLFIHSGFIYLTLFVAGGFTLSGATGWCGMAKLLAIMPWNRPQSS